MDRIELLIADKIGRYLDPIMDREVSAMDFG